ncbi:MAG: hypothetical protein KAH23_03965 [Kiritimatiellae bacterium]|nr:hypothetical protein [Kiritimatiellia bacterium]
MNKEKRFSICFWVMGVYDVLLGGAFALFFRSIYAVLDITLPNHPGYIFVPALFLVCGGIGEFLIARNPLINTDLVIIRLLMKLSFAGAVLYSYVMYGVPVVFVVVSVLSIFGVIKNVLFLRWAYSESAKSKGF